MAKILLIDDDLRFQHAVREVLRKEHTVLCAPDGCQGLARLAVAPFDLILCDLMMPGMSGSEIIQEIRRRHAHIPVILITGCGTVASAVEAMRFGANDVVEKPVNRDDLLNRISTILDAASRPAHLTALSLACKSLEEAGGAPKLFTSMVELCRRGLRADLASLSLRIKDTFRTVAYAAPVNGPSLEESAWMVHMMATEAGSVSAPMILPDVSPGTAELRNLLAQQKISSCIFYPLYARENLVGLLQIARISSEEPFGPVEVEMLSVLATQLVLAFKLDTVSEQLRASEAEIKRLHAQTEQDHRLLVQAEKMAVLGETTASLVHELSSPFSHILGLTEVLLGDKELSKDHREDLQAIQSQTKTCRGMIKNLLEFSRTAEPRILPVDLLETIHSAVRILTHDFSRAGVAVEVHLPETLRSVIGDEHQIQQVLINLLMNARQALEACSSPKVRIDAEETKESTIVRVHDNGPGISKENLSRIFDPFFTTKPVGEGTGLGLSICRNIMERHHGRLSVSSDIGLGACFTMEFFTSKVAVKA